MVARDGEPVVTTRRGPRRSAERLRRLLVMLPWLMEQGEVPVAEMAARFELSEAELIGDLELAALCGLPPFIDEMIDVFIDEGIVFAGLPRLFTRPLRLTAPEGFALLSSGRAAMQLPGADPDGSLARALDKLAAVLGEDGVVVDVPQPPATADLAAAVNDNARLSVRYWSAHRDEET
ncbi:MAG: proteasome accessory factor, partial [Ilumatobacteraceae bacterium]